MSQLIAVVHTAVIVNGERKIIEPGQPLPELNDHDAEALTKSRAALDPEISEQARRVAADAALQAAANFEAERQKVIAAQQSTAAPAQAPQEPVASAESVTLPPPPAAPAPQSPPPPAAQAPQEPEANKPAGKAASGKR